MTYITNFNGTRLATVREKRTTNKCVKLGNFCCVCDEEHRHGCAKHFPFKHFLHTEQIQYDRNRLLDGSIIAIVLMIVFDFIQIILCYYFIRCYDLFSKKKFFME
jgi:hypothetical protein